MKSRVKKKRRKVRGRDWHGWACKMPKNDGDPKEEWVLCYWSYPAKPKYVINQGKWVRVKFVEVD